MISTDKGYMPRKNKEEYQYNRRRPIDQARQVARDKYAWPGGYQLAVVTTDGGILCPECVRAEWFNIADSDRREIDDGWRPMGADIVHEGEETQYCDHCNRQLNNEEED